MAITLRLLVRNINKTFYHSGSNGSKQVISNLNTEESDKNVTKDWKIELHNTMKVFPNFISEKEEDILIQEVDPYMKRLRYEFSHWDNVSKLILIDICILFKEMHNLSSFSLFCRRYMVTGKQNGKTGATIAQRFLIKFVEKHFHQIWNSFHLCTY